MPRKTTLAVSGEQLTALRKLGGRLTHLGDGHQVTLGEALSIAVHAAEKMDDEALSFYTPAGPEGTDDD